MENRSSNVESWRERYQTYEKCSGQVEWAVHRLISRELVASVRDTVQGQVWDSVDIGLREYCDE